MDEPLKVIIKKIKNTMTEPKPIQAMKKITMTNPKLNQIKPKPSSVKKPKTL
jgi:hypothetical protein